MNKNIKNTIDKVTKEYAPFCDIAKYAMAVGSVLFVSNILVNYITDKNK